METYKLYGLRSLNKMKASTSARSTAFFLDTLGTGIGQRFCHHVFNGTD